MARSLAAQAAGKAFYCQTTAPNKTTYISGVFEADAEPRAITQEWIKHIADKYGVQTNGGCRSGSPEFMQEIRKGALQMKQAGRPLVDVADWKSSSGRSPAASQTASRGGPTPASTASSQSQRGVVQGRNPAYLSQFPSADRVRAELRGADPMDTAARQMGALWQLQGVVKELSGFRFFRNQLTPDETRLLGEYSTAYQAVSQPYVSYPDKPKWYQMYAFYETDDGFRNELFTRFLSPALLAEYTKTKGDTRATVQTNQQAREQAFKQQQAVAQAELAQLGAQQSESQRQLVRCIAAGRSENQCLNQGLKQGFADILPAWAKNKPRAPGIMISGVYSGQGAFSATFGISGTGFLTCQGLTAPASAKLEREGNQVQVRLLEPPPADILGFGSQAMEKLVPAGVPTEWQAQRVIFAVRPDGKLSGPRSIRVTGSVPAGTGRTTTGDTITLYKTETRTCPLGILTPTGKATVTAVGTNIMEGMTTALQLMLDVAGNKDPIDSIAERAPDPGLRMDGRYAGPNDFDIEFYPTSAVIGCRHAVVARDYTVSAAGNRILVNINNSGMPLVLDLKPDGTLAGSGPVKIDGRTLVGFNGDQPVFRPVTDSCTVGVLSPKI